MGALARAIVAAFAAAGLGACTSTGAFECEADDQCQDGARLGRCESSGWCSFPDATCDSGHKYGAHAGEGLANACVDVPLGSGTDEPVEPVTTSASTATTTGIGDTSPLDGADEGSTSISTGATATTEPLTSGPAESSSGATAEDTGEPDDSVFFDDFERPDALALGNGWVEKHPTAFQLVDGQVVFESSALNFADNLWYREESELDVEVCIELRILATDPDNHPQVHARILPQNVADPGEVTAYILYVEGVDLTLRRNTGPAEYWSEPLSAPLVVGPWYRLCLRVVGTNPVELEGHTWIQSNDGTWTIHTELLVTDDGADRITEPGATGSSGADPDQVANLLYDNFSRTRLVP